MRMNIDLFGDNSLQVGFEPGPGENHPNYDTAVQMIMAALDALTRELLKDTKKNDWKVREAIYDKLDYLFDAFFDQVFPEIKPEDFSLSAAAIVYAEDMLINQAEKECKTYKQVLEEYEKKAKEYIKNREKLS